MPHLEKRTGDLVLRIVYDGAAEAGKTTNVHGLASLISLQRRGALDSPGTSGQRTAFFDWLDFAGGFLDGRRVRCQLVTVPGQPEVLHRRRYLLETADAIVFVADSRSEGIDEATEALATTRRILARRDVTVPVGVLVQANKQDLPGAQPPEVLTRRMALPPTVPVVPSVASAGEGVMQTFILASRLATDRVRAMLAEDLVEWPESHGSPEELHAAMQSMEASIAAHAASTAPPVERAAHVAATNTERPAHAKPPSSEEPPKPAEPPAFEEPPPAPEDRPRRNRGSPGPWPSLAEALAVSAGHIWPPVTGRSVLASAGLDALRATEQVRPWAPADPIELETARGWLLHSSERWAFAAEQEARLALLRLVRHQLAWADALPEGRAAFLVSEPPGGFRVWMLSPPICSCREALLDVTGRRDAKGLRQLWAHTKAGSTRLAELCPDASVVGGLDGVSVDEDRLVVLHLDAPVPSGTATEGRRLVDHFLRSVTALAREDADLAAWLASVGVSVGRGER